MRTCTHALLHALAPAACRKSLAARAPPYRLCISQACAEWMRAREKLFAGHNSRAASSTHRRIGAFLGPFCRVKQVADGVAEIMNQGPRIAGSMRRGGHRRVCWCGIVCACCHEGAQQTLVPEPVGSVSGSHKREQNLAGNAERAKMHRTAALFHPFVPSPVLWQVCDTLTPSRNTHRGFKRPFISVVVAVVKSRRPKPR